MSRIVLAEAIDSLVGARAAFVDESEAHVVVSGLDAVAAGELRARCVELGWSTGLVDSAGNVWPDDEAPDQDFARFRLTIEKPAAPQGILRLLTNSALRDWLTRMHAAEQWQIARLTLPLVTQSRVLLPWDAAAAVDVAPPGKNPRSLVREFGNTRRVPDDVRHWLAEPLTAAQHSDPAIQVWTQVATEALALCLPDEVGAEDGALRFRGPPRLILPPLGGDERLEQHVFDVLQDTMRWVFESERESEMRHILLANELARSGTPSAAGGTRQFLSSHLKDAWESAQIAYQMALAETSRDTLRVLSDLRKAIADETTKLSDQTRQLATSVAGALATGVGLVVARITASASADVVAAIMVVVALYVAAVIASGRQFIAVQRQLREQWQPRLYRFLPNDEYDRMVKKPAGRAERTFLWTAWLGGLAVLLLTIICAWPVLQRPAPQLRSVPSELSSPKSTVPSSHSQPEQSATPPPPVEANTLPETAHPKTTSASRDALPQ